jgi:sulfur relay protein TusB/DsrH
MSSLRSERRTLHLVVRAPWAGDALTRGLLHAQAHDAIVLAQEAVAVACAHRAPDPALRDALAAGRVHVLATDLAARGLGGAALHEGCRLLDDAAWVALVAACDASVTWY